MYQNEIVIVENIQKLSGNSFVDKLFLAISLLGEVYLFIIVAVVLYWLVNKRWAYKFIISFLTSTAIVAGLKVLVKRPRPYQHPSGRVKSIGKEATARYGEHSYSFPSGHSQCAAAISTGVLAERRKWYLWILFGLNIILVPFSRLYLGQHYLTDVLFGVLIGILVTIIVYLIFEYIKREEIVGIIILPIALILVAIAIYKQFYNKEMFQAIGAFAAFSIGYIIEKKYIRMKTSGKWWQQALKLIIGIAVIVGIQQGFKYILPYRGVVAGSTVPIINFYFDAIRYFLIGIWATVGAPLVFKLLFDR